MKDDMFVFDNVVHMYDNSERNVRRGEGERVAANLNAVGHAFSKPGFPANDHFLGEVLSVEEAYRLLFEESDTDLVMAQAVPLFGWWKDGFSPVERNYALAAAYPDRVIFCGAVDPLYQGVEGAVKEIERQVTELGAKSIKFYQVHRKGFHWRADDRDVAYPMWEKCLELGVTNVQFHKGYPFGTEYLEQLSPLDLQGPATDFPDLTFVIHHLGDPFISESINIAARWSNVWLAMSAWINVFPIRPVESLHHLGRCLRDVGPDRLVYGSEAFVWPKVQAYIDLFADMQIPEDLQDGYGYPALTREIKEKMFGLNYARLLGIDVETKKKELNLV